MQTTQTSAGMRILCCAVSVILAIALFFTTVLTVVIADVRAMLTKDHLEEIIYTALFESDDEKGKDSKATSGEDLQNEVVRLTYELLAADFDEDDVPFTKKGVKAMIAESTLPEFLSEKIAGVVYDTYTGKSKTSISGREFVRELERNESVISRKLGYTIDSEHKEWMAEWIDEQNMTGQIRDLVNGKISADGVLSSDPKAQKRFSNGVISGLLTGKGDFEDIVDGGLPVILKLVRELTATELLVGMLFFDIALICLLVLLNLKNIRFGLFCAGAAVIFAGLLFVVAALVAMVASAAFTGLIMTAVGFVLKATFGTAVITFMTGCVLLLAGIFLPVLLQKKQVNTKVKAPVSAPNAPVRNPVPPTAPAAQPAPVVINNNTADAYAVFARPESVVSEAPQAPVAPAEETLVFEDIPEIPVAEEEPQA